MKKDWLGYEPEIEDNQITEVLETEVLVAGGGMGGLITAASAAELGLKVLLIEKRSMFAMVKDESGGIGSRLQKQEGSEVDKWELLRDATMYSAGNIDEKLWLLWAEESGEAINWLEDRIIEGGGKLWNQAGYEQHPTDGFAYTKYLTGHRPRWGKKRGAQIISEYAVEKGADIRMDTGLVKLLRQDGRVIGAIVQDSKNGEYIRINASKGVVVATGGYGNNMEMLEALQPETHEIICRSVCDGHGMGDGIRACIWAGAMFDDVHTSIVFDRGLLRTDETPSTCNMDGVTCELNAQPWMKVNLNGERFANESVPYDFIVHTSRMQPGSCYCVIFDAKYESDVEKFEMAGCSRLIPFPNGAPTSHDLPEMKEKLSRFMTEGRYVKADSIEELAEKLNIPVDNLVRSVARYNELAALGRDDDFGKLPHHLSTIDQPPFYGGRACGFLLATVDGIRMNTDMLALDKNGEPIPGLYVVGNDSGGYFAHTYFSNVTGCAAGRTLTFARRTARQLASL